MKPKCHRSLLGLIVSISFHGQPSLHAVAVSWDGGVSTANFADAANWSDNNAPNSAYTYTRGTRSNSTVSASVVVNNGTTLSSSTITQGGLGTGLIRFSAGIFKSSQTFRNSLLFDGNGTLTGGSTFALGATGASADPRPTPTVPCAR